MGFGEFLLACAALVITLGVVIPLMLVLMSAVFDWGFKFTSWLERKWG